MRGFFIIVLETNQTDGGRSFKTCQCVESETTYTDKTGASLALTPLDLMELTL